MLLVEAPVERIHAYDEENVLVVVHSPEIAGQSNPGQFVMASLEEGLQLPSPLLKRALAVYSVENDQGIPVRIGLLLKVVGEGTRRLADVRKGDRLSLIGPLGNGFMWEPGGRRIHLIAAGGIGIASVLLLAQRLRTEGEEVHLIYGAATRLQLVGIEDFEALGIPIVTTTEDGSAGVEGLITKGLQRHLDQLPPDREKCIYTCGPNAMMEAVSELAARHGIPCQISVEVKMACGFGVCLGCSVKTVDSYRLACTHGPVFPAERFIWRAPGGEDRAEIHQSRDREGADPTGQTSAAGAPAEVPRPTSLERSE